MTWQKSSQVICYQVPLLKNHLIYCCRSQAATCGSNASFFWASIHSFEIVELHRVQYGGFLVLWVKKKTVGDFLKGYMWRGQKFSLFEMLRCYNQRLFQHTFRTHAQNLLPTGYEGIPFIVGLGDCLRCALRVCCNFLGHNNTVSFLQLHLMQRSSSH